MNPFLQNGYLQPIASLNRLPVTQTGETASALCSAAAITTRIHTFLQEQSIPVDADWLYRFSACLDDPASPAHTCLDAIAFDVCRVPLTLKRVTPLDHPDWTDAHWAHWQTIRRLYLAGGMLGTPFGAALLTAMRRCLAEHGVADLKLELAPHPPIISVIGAARYASRFCDNALALDLGHTNIKCGALSKETGGFTLHSYPIIPSREMQWDYGKLAAAEILHEHITDVITGLFLQVAAEGRDPGKVVCCSIANYVTADRFAARAGFGKLNLLTDHYAAYLSDALYQRLGERLELHFIHDGTAGAYATQTADWEHEAFLGLGTTLSVGFAAPCFDVPFVYEVVRHTL